MTTRRGFIKTAGLAVFSSGWGGIPGFLLRTAGAAADPPGYRRRKTLVNIFQRGAMDGLMAVAPLEDQGLQRLRPRLAIPVSGQSERAMLDLGQGFGLHPAFSDLWPLYREARMAIVHGVGSPDQSRSHFDAQDYMETGTPGRKGTASGWLNRAVGLLGHEATPFRAVAMTPAMPRSLYGDHPALAVADLQDFAVQVPRAEPFDAPAQTFESLYEKTSQALLRGTGRSTFEASKILASLDVAGYRPENGARYPDSPLGGSLRQVAMLIKAEVGLEVAFTETGGWDTHVQQGSVNGSFARRARDLSQSIAAFWRDLGPYQDQVALMTMTEFGRTVHENGSGGTDHGRASCMFVLGNQVAGGRVLGGIPPLDPDALEDGRDLPVTTDFRSVFAEVAGSQLGIARDDVLFPGWHGARARIMQR